MTQQKIETMLTLMLRKKSIGEMIKKSIKRHKADLKKIAQADYRYYFDFTEYKKALIFSESIKHTKGQAAGEYFKPLQWQRMILYILFGWRNKKNKKRRFFRVYLEIARKNGKTFFASAIALYAWLCEGERGCEGYCIATKKEQANITYSEIIAHIRTSSILSKKISIQRSALQVNGTRNIFRYLGKNSKTEDGTSPAIIVCDEYHAHSTNELLHVMESGTALREAPLTLITTTAGFNLNSPCYDERVHAARVLDEKTKDEKSAFFIFTMDENDSWENKKSWIKPNPSIAANGAVNIEWLEVEAERARKKPDLLRNYKTKNLNIWFAAKDGWIDVTKWEALGSSFVRNKKLTLEEFEKRRVHVGIDLSVTNDITAVCYYAPQRDEIRNDKALCYFRFFVPTKNVGSLAIQSNIPYDVWSKEKKIEVHHEAIDYKKVVDRIIADTKIMDVVEVNFDPHLIHFVELDLVAQGYKLVTINQSFARMGALVTSLEYAIMHEEFVHDENPLAKFMFQCTILKERSNGLRMFGKEKSNAYAKIDGMVALAMACGRAKQVREEKPSENDYVPLVL